FSWKRVDETGDPSAGAHDDRFHDHIVKAREYIEAIAHSRNDGGYASYVAAGLLDCVEVGMLRQLFHLLRSDIRTVCDRIVVEHAREIRRFDYSAEVRAHLGPRALVHIRRQCHDTFTSTCAARLASATHSAVWRPAMPATTGTRFPTEFTHVRRISTFSSKLSVALSPSDPSATMPVQP